jgi:hypothetical protein
MLVLAHKIFNSPPVFAWVLPLVVRLQAGKEETFLQRHGHVFLFFPRQSSKRRHKTMLKGVGKGQGKGKSKPEGKGKGKGKSRRAQEVDGAVRNHSHVPPDQHDVMVAASGPSRVWTHQNIAPRTPKAALGSGFETMEVS